MYETNSLFPDPAHKQAADWFAGWAARLVCLLALTIGLCFLAGHCFGADPEKSKGKLPANWSKLGLTPEQIEKVHAIDLDATTKSRDLQMQIDKLHKDAKQKQLAVLTDEQKKKLADLATGVSTPAKDK